MMVLDRISEQNLIAIVAVTPNKLNIGREIPGFEVDTIQREGHSPRADRETLETCDWILGLALDWQ